MDTTLKESDLSVSAWSVSWREIGSVFSKRRWDYHLGDRLFALFIAVAGVSVLILLLAIGFFLTWSSWPSIQQFGWRFLLSREWDPVQEIFGALPVIFGTLVSSLLAMAIAAPLGIGVALFLTELAPRRLGSMVGFLVEMLAAIPSVVYGLWGIFVLAPWLRTTVEPFLGNNFGFLPFFQGPPFGVGMLCAGLILAIMVIPTVCSLAKEVFRAIPSTQREAAMALGATQWETMHVAVLKSARSGLFGAVVLGLGRALGETMAVTMVIGNRSEISASLFAPSQTMASVIANEYAEALGSLHLAALTEIGLTLFLVTFLINGVARWLVHRVGRQDAR